MNSNASFDVSAFIEEQDVFAAQDYCTTATAGLLMWYYLLTFDKEVAYFWRRRPSGACALFLANRYLTLVVSIYDSPWWSLSTTYTGCAAAAYSQFVLEFSQYIVWAAFSCLRVYALGRQWAWAALVLLLFLAPVAVNAVPLLFLEAEVDPTTGCSTVNNMPVLLSKHLDILSRVSLIVADCIVILFTWSVTHRHCRHNASRAFGTRKTLASVLYENGGIYFVLLTILNTLYLIFSMLSIALASAATDRASFLVRFIEPLTAILTTHFLIALQEASSSSGASAEDSDSTPASASVDTLRFVRADVDSWARSECASRVGVLPAVHGDAGAGAVGGDLEDGAVWGEECLEALEGVLRGFRGEDGVLPMSGGAGA